MSNNKRKFTSTVTKVNTNNKKARGNFSKDKKDEKKKFVYEPYADPNSKYPNAILTIDEVIKAAKEGHIQMTGEITAPKNQIGPHFVRLYLNDGTDRRSRKVLVELEVFSEYGVSLSEIKDKNTGKVVSSSWSVSCAVSQNPKLDELSNALSELADKWIKESLEMMAKAKWKQMIGIRMTKPARISMQSQSSNPPVKWTWPISPEYTKVGKLTTVTAPAASSSSSSSSSTSSTTSLSDSSSVSSTTSTTSDCSTSSSTTSSTSSTSSPSTDQSSTSTLTPPRPKKKKTLYKNFQSMPKKKPGKYNLKAALDHLNFKIDSAGTCIVSLANYTQECLYLAPEQKSNPNGQSVLYEIDSVEESDSLEDHVEIPPPASLKEKKASEKSPTGLVGSSEAKNRPVKTLESGSTGSAGSTAATNSANNSPSEGLKEKLDPEDMDANESEGNESDSGVSDTQEQFLQPEEEEDEEEKEAEKNV